MSFGASTKSQSQQQSSTTNPWEPTIPFLRDLVGRAHTASANVGPTETQKTAFESLKEKAGKALPWLEDIGKLASDQFAGVKSMAGTVTDAYDRLKTQIGDYASGAMLDFSNNPYIQSVLKQAGDDAAARSNAMFIGAGRDPTGNAGGQAAMATAVTKAQTPLLFDLYKDAENKRIDAAKTLYGAGTSTATTAQGLDESALAGRAAGVQTAQAYRDAELAPETTILNLEQQLKNMPFEDLSLYASLLFPAAGLGQQTQGQASGKSSGYNFGLSLT